MTDFLLNFWHQKGLEQVPGTVVPIFSFSQRLFNTVESKQQITFSFLFRITEVRWVRESKAKQKRHERFRAEA